MLQTLQKKSGQMSFQARMSHEVLVHAVFAEAFIPLTFTVPILANSLLCYFYTDSLQAAARDKTAQDREDAQAARDIMEMNLAE
ncbi:unnamed protein product, partial [Mesorhabditis spiculigera]